MLRLERGRALDAMPIYLPRDPAIPAQGVAAKPSFTRSFQRDKAVLQREAVGGAPWLEAVAYLALLSVAVAWIAALTLGLRRLAGPVPDRPSRHGRLRVGLPGTAS
jgi:hypothetical protein